MGDHVRRHKIAAIPGDGVGKEVVPAALDVLSACAERGGDFALEVTQLDWGSERYHQSGAFMPPKGIETLKQFDAILFGAVGTPNIPDHVTLWGLRLAICQSLDQYANVRPARVLKGIQTPLRIAHASDIDWVIVRENSEGEYSGQGGTLAPRLRGRASNRSRNIYTRRRSKDHAICIRHGQGASAKKAYYRDEIERTAVRFRTLG